MCIYSQILSLPQEPSHQKYEGRENIAHGKCECGTGIFHACVEQILVDCGPANTYIISQFTYPVDHIIFITEDYGN